MTHARTPTAVQGSVPGGFHEVLRWKLSDHPSHLIAVQLLAIPLVLLVLLVAFGFHMPAQVIGRSEGRLTLSIAEVGTRVGLCLVGCAATIVLHELVHGLTMSAFGARPQYGVLPKKLLFYATASGYGFHRNAYLTVVLAPLVILSGLAILGIFILRGSPWTALLALCAALNAGGAAADLWASFIVVRYPKAACVVDERDGFRVLLQDV